jgi:hypothetical protein
MAICDDCFQEFLHPLVHELMDKNQAFNDRYGLHARWDWDADSATLTFTDPAKPTLRIATSVVGTTEGDSWEWTWANRNFEALTKRDIELVRAFGETNRYEQLTSAFLEADEYTGWEMTAVAAHLLSAEGGYRFPTEHGFCYLIYRKIEEIGKPDADDLFGAMSGTVTVAPGVDLTEPTDESGDAASEASSAGSL